MGKSLTRAGLAAAVFRDIGLSHSESAKLVSSVLEEISATLERGELVRLSTFGTFVVAQKGERLGRNPKTGEEVIIPPRRVLKFRPSGRLKEKVNVKLANKKK